MPIPGATTLLNYASLVGAGAALVIGFAWLSAGLTGALLGSPAVAAFDRDLIAATRAHASPAALEAMVWVSRMHGTAGILAMSALVAAWLAWRRQRWLLPWLLASVPGGLLLNVAVKSVLQRARPESDYVAERLSSFSFPSGHTAGATVLYGFLVLLLWRRTRPVALRAAAVTGAAILVALVATSRIVLGMHYPSDCVAALAEGIAWLAICLVASRPKAP